MDSYKTPSNQSKGERHANRPARISKRREPFVATHLAVSKCVATDPGERDPGRRHRDSDTLGESQPVPGNRYSAMENERVIDGWYRFRVHDVRLTPSGKSHPDWMLRRVTSGPAGTAIDVQSFIGVNVWDREPSKASTTAAVCQDNFLPLRVIRKIMDAIRLVAALVLSPRLPHRRPDLIRESRRGHRRLDCRIRSFRVQIRYTVGRGPRRSEERNGSEALGVKLSDEAVILREHSLSRMLSDRRRRSRRPNRRIRQAKRRRSGIPASPHSAMPRAQFEALAGQTTGRRNQYQSPEKRPLREKDTELTVPPPGG